MPKQKYYHVDTKKIEGLHIEDKSDRDKGTGMLIPNLTRAGKANIQANALNQANENEEYESYCLLHLGNKWIDRFKDADNKRRI